MNENKIGTIIVDTAFYMQYFDDEQAIAAITEAGRRLYMRGMVAANDGNISCLVSKDQFWITASGVSKGFLQPENMVKLNLAGEIIAGKAPSSETALHIAIYKANNDIGGIVHAHPPYATAFALTGIPLINPELDEARIALGDVPLAAYAPPGSLELADNAASFAKDHHAVLLPRHGAVAWGVDIWQGLWRMENLEQYAKILAISKNLTNNLWD